MAIWYTAEQAFPAQTAGDALRRFVGFVAALAVMGGLTAGGAVGGAMLAHKGLEYFDLDSIPGVGEVTEVGGGFIGALGMLVLMATIRDAAGASTIVDRVRARAR